MESEAKTFDEAFIEISLDRECAELIIMSAFAQDISKASKLRLLNEYNDFLNKLGELNRASKKFVDQQFDLINGEYNGTT